MNDRPVPKKPKVRGRRVWLRPIEEDDLEAYYVATNEYDPGWWAGYGHPMSRRAVRQWYDQTVLERHGKDGYWFTICRLGSDDFRGTVWLSDIDHRVPGAAISIFVASPGAGLGSDAICAAVDFGFSAAGLTRIWGFTNEDNTRSLRSFERNGFQVEGRMRGAGRDQEHPYDLIQFSMTVEDWRLLDRPKGWQLNAE